MGRLSPAPRRRRRTARPSAPSLLRTPLPSTAILLAMSAVLVHVSHALPPPLRVADVLRQKDLLAAEQEEEEEPLLTSTSDYSDVDELYFVQKLNHLQGETDYYNDPSAPETFQQRYFYSARYVSPSATSSPSADDESEKTAYAFLCAGGEGPSLSSSVLVDSVHCTGDMIELARKLHEEDGLDVHLFALEHRYYGKSYPTFLDGSSPVDNKNLIYLTSRQALADMALFIKTTSSTSSSVTSDNGVRPFYPNQTVRWITFGGSYPGMLAAWARLKYPNLVYAAVSNSSPVQAQMDFPEYLHRVAEDLKYETIGGSDECHRIVEEGHAEIVSILQTADGNGSNLEGREQIAELFNVCGGAESLANEKNVGAFVGDGVINVPAQSNDPSCSGGLCNIEHICEALIEEHSKDPSASLVNVLATVSRRQHAMSCLASDWDSYLYYLSSPDAKSGGLRSWLWQTCNEFGFYQTCNAESDCPYGKGFHTVEQDLEICDKAFGVSADAVVTNVARTNEYYGGWSLESDRIIFTNGDVDPWAELAVTGDRGSAETPTIWVKGSSHHFWTHTVKESDSESVVDARLTIHGVVMEWLEQDATLSA